MTNLRLYLTLATAGLTLEATGTHASTPIRAALVVAGAAALITLVIVIIDTTTIAVFADLVLTSATTLVTSDVTTTLTVGTGLENLLLRIVTRLVRAHFSLSSAVSASFTARSTIPTKTSRLSPAGFRSGLAHVVRSARCSAVC